MRHGKTFGLSAAIGATLLATPAHAGDKLYGVHWWGFNDGWRVGDGTPGGSSVETVLTHSVPWWAAGYFKPLFQEVATNRDATVLTRVDYNWGETVPAPPGEHHDDQLTWHEDVLGVVNELGDFSRTWIIGNEPNIVGEGNHWPDNQITPEGYAQVYHRVRQAIKAVRPGDEVLVAAPSPGGVIPGVRWMDGNQWLGQTLDAILALPDGGVDGVAIHAYGNPFATPAQAVAEFHDSYVSQLGVIDARGLTDVPVYLTEWNRSTRTTGNLAANEAATAEFIRRAFADVHSWNQTPGNHNIVSLGWFVFEDGYGDWNQYSLEWWRTRGNPEGHPGDLWTAYQQMAAYPAGIKGTRPQRAAGDFDGDGDVDAFDLGIWQTGFGTTYAATADRGDADYDGDVDAFDLGIWQTAFDGSAAVPAAPEPAVAGVLLAGLLTATRRLSGCRRRVE